MYRNGPGIFKVGGTRLRHLFDGFAILHQFHMSKGKVTYRSRVLDTDTWVQSVKANRLVATQFGTFETPDPCKTRFAKSVLILVPFDSAGCRSKIRNRMTASVPKQDPNTKGSSERLFILTRTPSFPGKCPLSNHKTTLRHQEINGQKR